MAATSSNDKARQPDRIRDKASHDLVLQLLELEEGLTRFEVGFIESLVRQLESGVILSAKQRRKLHEIYEQRIEAGDVAPE
jgi:hypothetical protein